MFICLFLNQFTPWTCFHPLSQNELTGKKNCDDCEATAKPAYIVSKASLHIKKTASFSSLQIRELKLDVTVSPRVGWLKMAAVSVAETGLHVPTARALPTGPTSSSRFWVNTAFGAYTGREAERKLSVNHLLNSLYKNIFPRTASNTGVACATTQTKPLLLVQTRTVVLTAWVRGDF